ncbi:MAG TPA: magnesium transporter [Armatimonadota bacterium]|nr:magnesium transporter [Armatimonadota bacterium]
MLFLAHILNRPVRDAAGARLGWVEDLVLTGLELFPRIEYLVLARRGRGAVFVPWDAVDEINGALRLAAEREALATVPVDPDAIFLRRDILDKQVVDINGRRVVRVNDLQLATLNNELRLIGADIGVGGLLRRLNLEGPVRGALRRLNGRLPERVIPWNYVEGLETEWASVRLNVSHRRLHELPPTDIADILQQLQPFDREELARAIDDETLADTLPYLEEAMQAALLRAMGDDRASDIVEMMPPDDAADALGELTDAQAERILHLMEPADAEDVRALLRYDEDTAGGLMTTEFIALPEAMTAAAAIAALRHLAPEDAETIYYIYVTDAAGRLRGVLSLRDLLTAAEETPVGAIMRGEVVSARVGDDQETVAHLFTRYHLLALPVVDDEEVLRGIVTVDDALDVLHEEAEEDLSRAAGAVEESAVLASPWALSALRLPWLLGTAAAGLLVALYLQLYREAPERLTSLLVLLPLVLLLGVQLGGQGAAVTQVALAEEATVGEILRGHLRRLWPVGLGLSVLAALLGAVYAWLGARAHPGPVGAVIALALVLEMLVGSLLPLLLHRLRWDPVLVSRPALAVLALLLGVPLLAWAL